jgi:hypothetical protein
VYNIQQLEKSRDTSEEDGMKNILAQKRNRILGLLIISVTVLVLVSCATQPYPSAYDPPGFFSGLLHGFLILFSFIGSLFTDYRIYAFPNSGGWYDFGFLIGASMFLGGGGASTR